jgi:hypothetical protein
MNGLQHAFKQTLARSRSSLAISVRTGRRSLALGTVLVLGSTLTVLATANTPPTLTSLNVSSPSVNEGSDVTINGTFTDPDATDGHNALIWWPDGTKQKVEIPVGQMSFQATRKMPDNGGNHVTVELRDRQLAPHANDNSEGQGKDAQSVPLEVNNVAPTFGQKPQVERFRGEPTKVRIKGTIVDPGADNVQVYARWNPSLPSIGDGQQCTMTTKRAFECEHTYPAPMIGQPKTFSVKLLVRDDDGSQSITTTDVTVP